MTNGSSIHNKIRQALVGRVWKVKDILDFKDIVPTLAHEILTTLSPKEKLSLVWEQPVGDSQFHIIFNAICQKVLVQLLSQDFLALQEKAEISFGPQETQSPQAPSIPLSPDIPEEDLVRVDQRRLATPDHVELKGPGAWIKGTGPPPINPTETVVAPDIMISDTIVTKSGTEVKQILGEKSDEISERSLGRKSSN